jgi:hypothetical protein
VGRLPIGDLVTGTATATGDGVGTLVGALMGALVGAAVTGTIMGTGAAGALVAGAAGAVVIGTLVTVVAGAMTTGATAAGAVAADGATTTGAVTDGAVAGATTTGAAGATTTGAVTAGAAAGATTTGALTAGAVAGATTTGAVGDRADTAVTKSKDTMENFMMNGCTWIGCEWTSAMAKFIVSVSSWSRRQDFWVKRLIVLRSTRTSIYTPIEPDHEEQSLIQYLGVVESYRWSNRCKTNHAPVAQHVPCRSLERLRRGIHHCHHPRDVMTVHVPKSYVSNESLSPDSFMRKRLETCDGINHLSRSEARLGVIYETEIYDDATPLLDRWQGKLASINDCFYSITCMFVDTV